MAGDPDQTAISRILENRTLRWTMKHCSLSYWFLDEVICHVPAFELRCPEVSREFLCESAVLDGAAVEAFLNGKISAEMLWAVYNIDLVIISIGF
jgi:hypothetical protein